MQKTGVFQHNNSLWFNFSKSVHGSPTTRCINRVKYDHFLVSSSSSLFHHSPLLLLCLCPAFPFWLTCSLMISNPGPLTCNFVTMPTIPRSHIFLQYLHTVGCRICRAANISTSQRIAQKCSKYKIINLAAQIMLRGMYMINCCFKMAAGSILFVDNIYSRVKSSDCQCQSRNRNILRHSGILGVKQS